MGEVGREEVEVIAVGLGPGSYTGIRSSLAIAQGWHLARGVLAIGVSSADAIAFEAWHADIRGRIEVAIDAQRNEIYSAGYELTDGGFELREELEIRATPRGFGRLVAADATGFFPDAVTVGFLGLDKTPVGPETLQAIYLREVSFVKAPAPRQF